MKKPKKRKISDGVKHGSQRRVRGSSQRFKYLNKEVPGQISKRERMPRRRDLYSLPLTRL